MSKKIMRLFLILYLFPIMVLGQPNFLKADQLARQKENKKANREYSRIIKEYPDSYVAYLKRANLNYAQQEFRKAMADYSKVIELNDTVAEAYAKRGTIGYVLTSKGEVLYKEVIFDFNKAIELKAINIEELYLMRGHAKELMYAQDGEGSIEDACADYLMAKNLGLNDKFIKSREQLCSW